MPTIVHTTIPVDDVDRAQRFYGWVFWWSLQAVGSEGPPYYFVMTHDPQPMPSDMGMMPRIEANMKITSYIGVDSIDASMAKVREHGGMITMEKIPVKGMGWMCHFDDSCGNELGLWETDETAGTM